MAQHLDVGLACVDICQSPKMDVLVKVETAVADDSNSFLKFKENMVKPSEITCSVL